MAWPPRKKRSGSGKTQRERTFTLLGRSFIVLVIGIALGLVITSRFAPDRADGLRAMGADIVSPVWEVVQIPVESIAGYWNNAGAYLDSARRVQALEAREALYQERRRVYEEAQRENRELRALMDVVDPARERVGSFAISGTAGGVYASQAIISGGAIHGVETGQPVRMASGLIGRTVEVGGNAARVMLVNDASSRIPVRVVRTGLPALVIGTNKPLVEVDISGPTNNEVEVGDRLVTSGDGGLFAPGIAVATVVAVDGPA
ncbi:MAG: rod shape-determining protein MreC, partial [Pacificimonas sp.]